MNSNTTTSSSKNNQYNSNNNTNSNGKQVRIHDSLANCILQDFSIATTPTSHSQQPIGLHSSSSGPPGLATSSSTSSSSSPHKSTIQQTMNAHQEKPEDVYDIGVICDVKAIKDEKNVFMPYFLNIFPR